MKKLIALISAVMLTLSCLSAGVFAVGPGTVTIDAGTGIGAAYDEDAMPIAGTVYNGGSIEGITPDQTIYLKIMGAQLLNSNDLSDGATIIDSNVLADDDYFKLKVKKDGDGRRLIDEVSQVSEKKDANGNRCGWLKIVIAPSDMTDEQKAELRLTFTAKEDNEDGGWSEDDFATVELDLWINNPLEKGDDYDAEPGDQFVYQPVSNENNELTWDDVAILKFTADDDASKFYARLSTKADKSVYQNYPDAELYFRNFSGNPNISTTSRATLILLNPWMQDDSVLVNPKSCHIYTKDSDGVLSDVTSLFTYLETDEEGNEVNGWRIKTRMLGSYVISNIELETDTESEPSDSVQPETVESAGILETMDVSPDLQSETDSITNNTKPNPPTGKN